MENQVPDLIDLSQTYLAKAITLYNKFIERRQEGTNIANKDALALEPNGSHNEIIDKLFNQAQNKALVVLKVLELFI